MRVCVCFEEMKKNKEIMKKEIEKDREKENEEI